MVTFETVLSVIPVLSLAVAITYYGMQIRNQNKNRQAQLFMRLFEHYMDKERFEDGWELLQMEWEDFDDFARKFDSSVNMDNYKKRYSYWSFWDGMGLLVKKKLVDKDMLYYLMGGYRVMWSWLKFKDVIEESRNRLDNPDLFVWFEYLADEMTKERGRRGYSTVIPENKGILTR